LKKANTKSPITEKNYVNSQSISEYALPFAKKSALNVMQHTLEWCSSGWRGTPGKRV